MMQLTDEPIVEAQPVLQNLKRGLTGKKGLTINETKLGVTLVLSKDECMKLGFEEDTFTKDVVHWVKGKIGL